ncbi:cyclic nucleotide-binding domain-containing protein [Desulfitobacterium sp.]|uniref:Crp/Fnr family transcriptional regulator n=1 Tax=Desulfitobacterium sp. TaxID=49981 RepID=UPI002B1EEEEE|nr:cyclic nucleotide-binding domain-containing protein [Desulfitobacterium sp.]MEA4901522.1 cyclic nucleotide-binding domain-containing protein [Desulfitobacterium sp.]
MEKGKIAEPRLNIPIIPMFDPIEELNMYTSLGSKHSFAKGSVIVSPGNPFNYIIFVISGQLEVNLISAKGTEKFMFKLYKNNIGMALFQDEDHEFRITATDNSTVCFFTLDGMVEILSRDNVLLKDFCLNLLQKANYFIMQSRDLYQSRPSSRM